MKRHATVCEEILVSHVSDLKKTLSRMFRIENYQKSTVKIKQSNLKTDKRHEQIFHQRGYADGKTTHEKILKII